MKVDLILQFSQNASIFKSQEKAKLKTLAWAGHCFEMFMNSNFTLILVQYFGCDCHDMRIIARERMRMK